MNIICLPCDVLYEILSWFNTYHRLLLRSTCHTIKEFVENQHKYWEEAAINEYKVHHRSNKYFKTPQKWFNFWMQLRLKNVSWHYDHIIANMHRVKDKVESRTRSVQHYSKHLEKNKIELASLEVELVDLVKHVSILKPIRKYIKENGPPKKKLKSNHVYMPELLVFPSFK